jgi:hypothetical protein
MTKPCNEKMKPSTLPSWGDSRWQTDKS